MDTDKQIRFRHRSSKLNKVKELDIFPKVEDSYKERSSVGGTCKLLHHHVNIL